MFKTLWKEIAGNLERYKAYPRIVGETGGKNFHLVHKSAEVRNAVLQSVRAGFEYQGKNAARFVILLFHVLFPYIGQKCSALSRLYVSSSLWNQGFKDQFLDEIAKIKVGPPQDWSNFMGPVMYIFSIPFKTFKNNNNINSGRSAYDKILNYITKAKEQGGEVLTGGSGDSSKGFFIQPTVILTKDPKSLTMREEIFGPVITVYVYDDAKFDETLGLIDSTTDYALTGSIFAQERKVLVEATNRLRNAAGNVYYNEKCTGAVVGQQPFGGSRASGTNDKAGSMSIFYRFVSARSIKENFVGLEEFGYPSNLV